MELLYCTVFEETRRYCILMQNAKLRETLMPVCSKKMHLFQASCCVVSNTVPPKRNSVLQPAACNLQNAECR